MKTEGEYNNALSKEFRKLWTQLFHIKTSDKFTLGISDFLIYFDSDFSGLEVKFTNKELKDNVLLLTHPFSGAQLTFLRHIQMSGGKSFGLVYIKELNSSYLVPFDSIPESGNWKYKDFRECNFLKINKPLDVQHMVGGIFGREIETRRA